MPALTNSTRRLDKATYVTIDPETAEHRGMLKRGLVKAAFVANLALTERQLELIRAAVDEQDRPSLDAVLETLGSLNRDHHPAGVLPGAGELAEIGDEDLIRIGELAVQLRRRLVNEVTADISKLRSDYRDRARRRSLPPPVTDAGGGDRGPAALRPALMGSPRRTVVLPDGSAVEAARVDVPAPGTGERNVRGIAVLVRRPTADAAERDMSETVTDEGSDDEVVRWARVARPDVVDRWVSVVRRAGSSARPATATAVQALMSTMATWVAATQAAVDAFREQRTIEPVGFLHLERLEMTPVGIERGELVHSVPLTPHETVNITHREWSVRTEEFESLVQDFLENFSEEGVTEKAELAQAVESQTKHSTTANVSASASTSLPGVTLSTAASYSVADSNQRTERDSRKHAIDMTRRASSRTRKEHKFSFRVTSVAGEEDTSVRTITNPTDLPMRVDYYQLMRKWRVRLYRYDLRLTFDLVIPNPAIDLQRRVNELRSLDDRIAAPFRFDLTPAELTQDNWDDISRRYGVAVTPPPPDPAPPLLLSHVIDSPMDQDADREIYETLTFTVDDRYEIDSVIAFAEVDPRGGFSSVYSFDVLETLGNFGPAAGGFDPNLADYYGTVPALIGKSGELGLIFRHRGITGGGVLVEIHQRLKPSALREWQYQTWLTLRDAAFNAFTIDKDQLRQAREALAESVGQYDALTLRRMEREEVMKGVLQWLFGPSFDLVPDDVLSLFTRPGTKMPTSRLIAGRLDQDEWRRVIEFGEFVKFIHHAIEWENLLFFPYPYFWDAPANWDSKLFLEHPDTLHRTFLRSGAMRVVLTIRPGFEPAFTSLVDNGAFGQLPDQHPYVTIGEEIRHAAETVYAGIPPADPADADLEAHVDAAELGVLIGEWHEYTSTSALDVGISTPLPDLA
jgi:hypothetical protein